MHYMLQLPYSFHGLVTTSIFPHTSISATIWGGDVENSHSETSATKSALTIASPMPIGEQAT
jgi:hypothetical protein